MIFWIDDDREVELLWVYLRKTCISVRAPLHRGSHSISVAEIVVVSHPNLIPVIDDWSAWEGEEKHIHELDSLPVVIHEGSQTPADTKIDPRPRVSGIYPVHIIPLFIGDHLQG